MSKWCRAIVLTLPLLVIVGCGSEPNDPEPVHPVATDRPCDLLRVQEVRSAVEQDIVERDLGGEGDEEYTCSWGLPQGGSSYFMIEANLTEDIDSRWNPDDQEGATEHLAGIGDRAYVRTDPLPYNIMAVVRGNRIAYLKAAKSVERERLIDLGRAAATRL
jgi:hypothetical protein